MLNKVMFMPRRERNKRSYLSFQTFFEEFMLRANIGIDCVLSTHNDSLLKQNHSLFFIFIILPLIPEHNFNHENSIFIITQPK